MLRLEASTKATLTFTFTLHLFFLFFPVQVIYSSMALKSLLSSSFHPARWGVTRKMEKKRDWTRTIIETEKSCQSSAATLFTLKDEEKKKPQQPSIVQTWKLYSHHARSCQFTRASQPPNLFPRRSSKLVFHMSND